MKFIKIFLFIFVAFLSINILSVNADSVTSAVTVTVSDFKDLTASAPTPTTVAVNTPVSFTSTITNNGNIATGAAFPNIFQLATGLNGQNPGMPTSQKTPFLMTLPANGSATATSVPYTFNVVGGEYSIRACADNSTLWEGFVAESNEDNNCSAWVNVTVTGTINTLTVTTTNPTNITQTTAKGGGTIIANGGTTVTESGIVWSATATFTNVSGIANGSTNLNTPWTSNMAGLTSNTTYHYRAYATNSAGTAYGADIPFTTSAPTPTIDLIPSVPTQTTTAAFGSPVSFISSIFNNGSTTTGTSFYNSFQLAYATSWDPGTIYTILPIIASAPPLMPALLPGASSNAVSVPYILMDNIDEAGIYFIRACADTDNRGPSETGATGTITESNEGNNCSAWVQIDFSFIPEEPTCNYDGYWNGSETGRDCGGSCPPCKNSPTYKEN